MVTLLPWEAGSATSPFKVGTDLALGVLAPGLSGRTSTEMDFQPALLRPEPTLEVVPSAELPPAVQAGVERASARLERSGNMDRQRRRRLVARGGRARLTLVPNQTSAGDDFPVAS